MKLLSWLFGRRPTEKAIPQLESGDSDFNIVGESKYQCALETIVGGRTEDSAEHACRAVLTPEPSNPHDRNAVRVLIDGRTVGYLSRDNAIQYYRFVGNRASSCEAIIVGGWIGRRGAESGHFGVKLDIDWPPKITKG